MHYFSFAHSKAKGGKFDLAVGHGQLTVIPYINFVVLEFQMLHTKFQGHWSGGSGEEGFFKVFTIYWYGGHLGRDLHQIYKVSFPLCLEAAYDIQLKLACSFRGESL